MNNILNAVSIMTGLGLFFGILIAIAYRFLRVQENPRIKGTEDLLPTSNCGACGEPGCLPFAEKLVSGEAQPSQCTVADAETIAEIAQYLGVDAGKQVKQVARIHCAGGHKQAQQIAEYRGFESCTAAAVVSGGGKGCSWGCLGLADCEIACTFDVIHMNANGLPVVDIDKCTACGDCVAACPKDLFEVVPINQKLFVQCNTPLANEAAMAQCNVACDGCGKCALDAAPGLIRMENNLPIVDYSGGGPALPEATSRCPTDAIIWLEGGQFDADYKPNAQSDKRYVKFS